MKNIRLIVPALIFLLASGCSVWNWTKETVDPNPKIDLEQYHMDDGNEKRLALMFTPLDEPVDDLIRLVAAQDQPPAPEWLELLFRHYPWIDGAAVVDVEGNVIFRHPQEAIKPLGLLPLLDFKGEWVETDIRASIDYTEFGPELYISSPLLEATEWMGLFIVHVDLRKLFNFCPEPKDLIIIDPTANRAYSGNSTVGTEAIAKLDWVGKLKEDVSGKVAVDGKNYSWLTRYIGDEFQLVYAVVDDPNLTPEKSWYEFW